MVNAAKELDNPFRLYLSYLNLRLDDVPHENIKPALASSYEYIENAMKDPAAKILVHCYAGISRSSSVVIHWLMRKHGLSYSKALHDVKLKRSVVQPNVGFERSLRSLQMQLCISH